MECVFPAAGSRGLGGCDRPLPMATKYEDFTYCLCWCLWCLHLCRQPLSPVPTAGGVTALQQQGRPELPGLKRLNVMPWMVPEGLALDTGRCPAYNASHVTPAASPSAVGGSTIRQPRLAAGLGLCEGGKGPEGAGPSSPPSPASEDCVRCTHADHMQPGMSDGPGAPAGDRIHGRGGGTPSHAPFFMSREMPHRCHP